MNTGRDDKAEAIMRGVDRASRYFESWESKFSCKSLEKYYDGIQETFGQDKDDYILNLVFSTFQIKRPSLMFKRPIFTVKPKPSRQTDFPEMANEWAQLAADTLNTYTSTNTMDLAQTIELALLDSGSYFGLVEVGFDADWVMNPNAGRPIVTSDFTTNPSKKDKIIEPQEIPIEEWIYVKRIPAHRFRVGPGDTYKSLEDPDWVGYYEFFRREELLSDSFNFNNLKPFRYYQDQYGSDNFFENDEEAISNSGLIQAWKIWHNRTKEFYLIAESEGGYQIGLTSNFKRVPLFPLKFYPRRRGFYPIPVFFNWRSPQNEINEQRNQLREMRRRVQRRYKVKQGSISAEELEKFLASPTDSYIEVETLDSIQPLESLPLDASIQAAFPVGKDDFNIISGTSSEARGEADRTTATQASITNNRSTLRESAEREIVADWLSKIGLEILNQIRERMTLDFWIKTNQDAGAWGQDVSNLQEQWKLISADDLGDMDFLVNVEVESLSPIVNEQELNKLLKFVAMLKDNPHFALHPGLITELAAKLNFNNPKVIKFFQEMAQIQMVGMISQAQGGMGGGMDPNQTNNAQKTVEQMTPPNQAEIENQIAAQGIPSAT